MKFVFVLIAILLSGCNTIPTAEPSSQPTRIYQVDKFGNTQYHKPSEVVINNRIYQVDKFGNTQYHKPSKKISGK